MAKWRVRARQTFEFFYSVEAETEEEALKKYENCEQGCRALDDGEPVGSEEYQDIEQVEA